MRNPTGPATATSISDLVSSLVRRAYRNRLVAAIFHTSVHCLKRELKGCDSVLDLGCGPDSPLQYCRTTYSVGVDAYRPYIQRSRLRGIHTHYVRANLARLEIRPKSFDAVVLVEVLEHLDKEEAARLLGKITRWARKRVIITTPNGYLPQGGIEGNVYQTHRSGWTVHELRARGFRAYGMAGIRFLRTENTAHAINAPESIYGTLRWRPAWLWLIISEITQLIAYYLPSRSFETFYVTDVER